MSYLSIRERFTIPTYDNEEYATTGRVVIDHDKCNVCGMCVEICPGAALLVTGVGKNKKVILEEDFPQCMACNACGAICEQDAITVSVPYDFGYFYKKLCAGELMPPRKF